MEEIEGKKSSTFTLGTLPPLTGLLIAGASHSNSQASLLYRFPNWQGEPYPVPPLSRSACQPQRTHERTHKRERQPTSQNKN
jgi:hypothetical protein